jgi:hypothetical protein
MIFNDSFTVNFNDSIVFIGDASSTQTTQRMYNETRTMTWLPTGITTFWTPVNITFVVISLTAIAGNLFSCIVIASYKPLRKRLTNYFIVNQCFLDLVTAFVLILNTIFEYVFRTLSGPSLYAACYLVYTRIFYTSVFAASLWNLSVLAVERYLKIVHAIRYKTSMTQTKIVITCVAVWVFGFLYRSIATLPVVTVIDGVCRVSTFKSAAGKMAFGLGVFLGDFLLPICTITICYIQITRKLRRINATSTASSSTTPGVRRNIIRLLMAVTVVFLMTVGPRQLMVFYLTVTQQPINITSLSYLVTLCLNYVNCSINPFVYLFKYDDFRHGAMKLLRIKGKVATIDDENSIPMDSTYNGGRYKTSTAVNTLKSKYQLGSDE